METNKPHVRALYRGYSRVKTNSSEELVYLTCTGMLRKSLMKQHSVKDEAQKALASSLSFLLLQRLQHCRSVTTLITCSLLSSDSNDFPIKSGLMYCSICTQSLCLIDSSQMSLPEHSSRAVIQKGSALIGPNVMRPGCAHANKTKC